MYSHYIRLATLKAKLLVGTIDVEAKGGDLRELLIFCGTKDLSPWRRNLAFIEPLYFKPLKNAAQLKNALYLFEQDQVPKREKPKVTQH